MHLSRDGEVMVIHDATLERTTTGTGPVRERTAAELGALRLKDRGGAVTAEPVPTLDQVVALAAAGKRQMLLEIKTDEQRRRYPGIEEKVFAVLDRHRFTRPRDRDVVRGGDLAAAPPAPPGDAHGRALLAADAARVGDRAGASSRCARPASASSGSTSAW